MAREQPLVPWRPVALLNGSMPDDVGTLLKRVDVLRSAWEANLQDLGESAFHEARQRSLRRHAIETGIIERLYDVDWGVTEALVAEGISADVAARSGGIDDDALATIHVQLDALQFLTSALTNERSLSLSFIRELHAAITRNQRTYQAEDSLGRPVEARLHHGEWKSHPNWVQRPDGTRLECTPPEHVAAEMERLLDLHSEMGSEHPITRAAWLHHRFILIHPFEDGNGRVARALVLLVLLESHYAPLVVDRRQRVDYLRVLDEANDGDLWPLVRLFAKFERKALTAEFYAPEPDVPAKASTPVDVARAYAERLKRSKEAAAEAEASRSRRMAEDLHQRVQDYLEVQRAELSSVFESLDSATRVGVFTGSPDDERGHWWRRQLIRSANSVDFYANLEHGSWWTSLKVDVLDETLSYVVAVQKVGHGESGVLAITAFADLRLPGEEAASASPAFTPTGDDGVFIVNSEDLNGRWAEIVELLDRTLAAAVDRLGRALWVD